MGSGALSGLGMLTPTASLTTELEELAARLRGVTVRISSGRASAARGARDTRFDGVGAGILWPVRKRRLVLTNAHVAAARRGDTLLVEGSTGAVEGAVMARDEELDLALLELDASPNEWPEAARLGDALALRAGEIVVALGHPFGVGGALSVGVVHAVPNADDIVVRADIRLAPGNSGGPLATLDGAVIGVNCMIARGLGIAIASHVAERFVREVAGR